MATLNSVYYQYRSFDNLYVFKVHSAESLVVKIFDLSQRRLFKRAFSNQALQGASIKQVSQKTDFPAFLETLVQKGLLPRKHFSVSQREVRQEDCLQEAAQAIQQFKPKILTESQEMEGFSCPLTLEVFQDPVMDEHGHTFERSAIEEHLKRKNECPFNREPIHSLVPNRLVQQTIEEWQKRDPIPNFSLFQKENPKLASTNLQMAQTYVEEKEYREGLEFYAKAFQYTRNWSDYVGVPPLFEKTGETEKAALAYLYLAHYQLEDKKLSEAIQTLEKCQQGRSACVQMDLLLIKLYHLAGQPQKGMELAVRAAKVLPKQNPKQAILVYKELLTQDPNQFDCYFCLTDLLKSPQEKAQVLLKGACHALETGNYKAAEHLCLEGETYSKDSFVDQLVTLDLLSKQEKFSAIYPKLISLAESFEKRGLIKQMLKACKMVFQLEKTPKYAQKIVSAYQTLQKPQKEFEWSFTSLSLLMKEKRWEEAETCAKGMLQKSQALQQKMHLYKTLEEVYTHWHGHELQDLWPKLGKAYQENNQLDLAEKTYRKAFERFHQFEEVLALAEVLKKSGKTQQSIQLYYEAAAEALLEQNNDGLFLCTREIKQIDPRMQHLDLNQRMYLLTQEHILKLQSQNEKLTHEVSLSRQENEKLTHEVSLARQENKRLSEEVVIAHTKITSLEEIGRSLKEKALQEEKRRIAEEQEIVSQSELARKIRGKLLQFVFNKAKWEKYFGDVGVEPPLPKDIVEILKSPCPYWEGKRVLETHILVLIPQTVNGRPLTLNRLQEFIQSPKGGGHRAQYDCYYSEMQREMGNKSLSSSYWALMTKDVVPNSRNKTYAEQQALIKRPYVAPGGLEIATGILMHHVQTGERLYSDSLYNYTRCQEKLSNGCRVVVGSFGSSGLHVSFLYFDENRLVSIGLGGVRKF